MSHRPAVIRAALMVMPWIDTDTASRTGNSWLLDTLWNMAASPVTGRPRSRASRKPKSAGWWPRPRAGLCMCCSGGTIMGFLFWGIAALAVCATSEAGHVHVLERWRTNVGLHAFDFEGERALRCEAIDLACKHGRLEVVKWWFDKFPQDQWVASQQAVAYAILAKHYHVSD